MKTSLLPVATAGTGLVAGLFVAFAIAVMPALHGADARTFVVTMQRINVSIVNPLFLLLFLGSPVVLGIGAFLAEHGPERRWALAAFGLTVVALVVTFAVNIPLNDRLAAAGSTDPAAAREAFEHTWNVANVARTVLMSASFAASLVALRL
ncbi:MAG: hypothetical protein JWO46_405 [Nocardioidaceae bacterium]|nr:hypothetical protein [Nocardioidaceae bacterium]